MTEAKTAGPRPTNLKWKPEPYGIETGQYCLVRYSKATRNFAFRGGTRRELFEIKGRPAVFNSAQDAATYASKYLNAGD